MLNFCNFIVNDQDSVGFNKSTAARSHPYFEKLDHGVIINASNLLHLHNEHSPMKQVAIATTLVLDVYGTHSRVTDRFAISGATVSFNTFRNTFWESKKGSVH